MNFWKPGVREQGWTYIDWRWIGGWKRPGDDCGATLYRLDLNMDDVPGGATAVDITPSKTHPASHWLGNHWPDGWMWIPGHALKPYPG